jgi:hypothetical protein
MNFITDYELEAQVRAHEEGIARLRLVAEARRGIASPRGAARAQLAGWVNRAIFRVDPCAQPQ